MHWRTDDRRNRQRTSTADPSDSMDPLRPSSRTRLREHSPEIGDHTGTPSPARHVRARTSGPGAIGSPPLSPRRHSSDPHAAGPSTLAPRTAIPDLEADLDAYLQTELDDDLEDGDVEGDVERLEQPLGQQVQTWLGHAGNSVAAHFQVFDDEPQARAFARLLERLGQEALPTFSPTAQGQLREQVRTTILMMARDSALCESVFLVAQTALGDCRDNLLDGLSKVMLTVRSHQMVLAVKMGKIDEAKANHLTGQRFRLSLLETATNRFIGRQKDRADLPPWKKNWLEKDSVETMVHAKAALKKSLNLPQDTAQDLTNLDCSVLEQPDIAALKAEVLEQAADPQAYRQFLLNDVPWRNSMQALHKDVFGPIDAVRDDDPYYELLPPSDSESPEAFAHAEAGKTIYAAWELAVNEQLKCWRLRRAVHYRHPAFRHRRPDLRGLPSPHRGSHACTAPLWKVRPCQALNASAP